MADMTPRLMLPFMSTAQSNKELTFNELAAMVDTLVGAVAIDKDLNTPPGAPEDGDLYIVNTAPTGAWAGKPKHLAFYIGGWHFIAPSAGWVIWVEDESNYYRYNTSTSTWVETVVMPVNNLVDLLDVDASAPGVGEDGYVLAWDNDTTKFILQPGPTSLAGLSDVNVAGITDGQTLIWDASEGEFVPGSTTSTFLELTDTPGAFTGAAGKAVFVNDDEDGLEFREVEESGGGGVGATTFLELTDTPPNYISQAGRVPVVNEAEDGLEFADLATLSAGLPPGGATSFVLRKVTGADYETEWVDLSTVVPVIPNGGLTQQVLAKVSDDDGDTGWVTVPIIPLGGLTGQVLVKQSDDDADADWADFPSFNEVPEGGAPGQVLFTDGTTYGWADLPDFPDVNEVPGGGTDGQVLTNTSGGYAWADPAAPSVNEVPTGGTDGQVLTNTAGGYAWADPPSATVPTESIIIAVSDETTALTTGVAKITLRMPYGFTLSAVRASVTTAPTGSTLTVDINEGGVSVLSTKLTIDAGEKTSTTAATAAVISDATLADDAEITIDIDAIGSTIAGAGLKVYLIGQKT